MAPYLLGTRLGADLVLTHFVVPVVPAVSVYRSCRAVLRVHKEVLGLQTELWMLMMRSMVKVADVDKALDALEAGTLRAHQVYKR